MSFVDYLADWINRESQTLALQVGIKVVRYDEDHTRRAIAIAIENPPLFLDFVAWDSGEAELGYGTVKEVINEHHEFKSITELDRFIEYLMFRVRVVLDSMPFS